MGEAVTQNLAREELVEFMHNRNEFDYDQCDHGLYSGPLAGQAYAMCERQADALLAAGYGKLNEGSPVEWGVRWPLSSESHGDGKTVTWEENSREEAEAVIEDYLEEDGAEPSSVTLVWRRVAGPWQQGEPPKLRKASRDEILTAQEALDDYLDDLAIGIRTPVNQMRLVESLKFFLEGDGK